MWTLFTSPQLYCQRNPATTCIQISNAFRCNGAWVTVKWKSHRRRIIHSTLKRHSHGENDQKQLIEVRELNALSCFTISNSTRSRMQRHSMVVPTIDSHLINVRVTSIQLHHISAERQPNWNESAIAKLKKGRKKEKFRIAVHACRGRNVYKHRKDSFATPFNCSIFRLQYEHGRLFDMPGTCAVLAQTQGTQDKIENYVIIIHISFCWYPPFKFMLWQRQVQARLNRCESKSDRDCLWHRKRELLHQQPKPHLRIKIYKLCWNSCIQWMKCQTQDVRHCFHTWYV